ncbi:hypothetical protein [Streptomyces triculaminicus]|uniref:hypothetical protein n=1 Tax=Streptomyces triculaminicus TaxID=2816232 RepID=UPI003796C591
MAEGLTVEYDPSEQLPGCFRTAAAGIEEQLSRPEHGVVVATRVVLRQARAHAFGSQGLAFKVAGYLAARKALERSGQFPSRSAAGD